MLNRHAFIAGALALLIAVPVAYAQIAIPDNIAKAVANPARVQKQKDRDAGRKPAEVFALAGLKTGDKVIELGSFGHYDSEIISAAIGPTGKLYMYDLPYMANREAAFKAFVDGRANAEHKTADFDKIDYPQGIDMVFLQPEQGAGNEKAPHLMTTIIENARVPIGMIPLTRIGMLVEMSAIKIR